jgi:hypothetical protein
MIFMDFLTRHKIIILLIGIGVAGVAWFGMTSSGPTPLLTTESLGSGPDQELVETLLALRSVKLDGTIFSEPAFTQLQDYSQPIIQEPVGRENPFAPLPGSAAAAAVNTAVDAAAAADAASKAPKKK